MPTGEQESEWQTRRRRIDPRLEALGWSVVPADRRREVMPEAVTEYETASGPADYDLSVDGRILRVVASRHCWLGSSMGRGADGRTRLRSLMPPTPSDVLPMGSR